MGLFSFFKKRNVNKKLKKADDLADELEYDAAEVFYQEIIDDHAEAVTRLANLYLKQSKGQRDPMLFLQKGLDCENKLTNGVSNYDSYHSIKEEIQKEIYRYFSDFKEKNQLENALAFSKVLILHVKDHNIVYEHYNCLFEYSLGLPKDKARDSENILEEIYNTIKEKDYLSKLCLTVKKELFTRALEYSKSKNYEHSNRLCSLFLDLDYDEAKILFIENCINNIANVKNSNAAQKTLLEVVKGLNDKSLALKYLEQLVKDIPSVKDYFVKLIIDVSNVHIKENKYEESFVFLKKAITTFPDNQFYEQVLNIGKHFIADKSYSAAIEILNFLIGKHSDSEPLLARCFVEQSLSEKSLDAKRILLLNGFHIRDLHSTPFNTSLFETVFNELISAIKELSLKYGEYGYYSDAYELLDIILVSAPDSINTHTRIKLLEIKSIESFENQLKSLDEAINQLKQKANKIKYSDKTNFDLLFKELIEVTIKITADLPPETSITDLNELKNRVDKELRTEILKIAIEHLELKIAESNFKKGKNLELLNNFIEAIVCYDIICVTFKSYTSICNEALARKYISLLKINCIEDIQINREAITEFLASQKRSAQIIDLAYRFTVYLIGYESFDDACKIIDQYLPKSHKSTQELKIICSNGKILQAKSVLQEYNEKIIRLRKNELSLTEAAELLENIQIYENRITCVLLDLSGKVIYSREYIGRYVLSLLFAEEKYLDCFAFIENNFSDFYKDENLFRNAAISTLGTVLSGGLTIKNYREIISTWLTAVFYNKLFIKSLANTTWDDKFTFSLQDALGFLSEAEIDELPENVNFEDVDDLNISIGTVQRTLLNSFEGALSNGNYPKDLSSQALGFYRKEKDALTALYSLEIENCDLYCTPYFTVYKNELYERISSALEKELLSRGGDYEEVLKIGILYSLSGRQFKNYSDAIILKNKALDVVDKMNQSQIGLIFSPTNISKLNKYEELIASFANDLRSILSEKTQDETEYENIIAIYLKICSVVPDANLCYMLSNFANRVCIADLNEESISTSKGLKILTDVYDIIKSHPKLNSNLQEILNSAIVELIMEGDVALKRAVYNLIDKHSKLFEKGIIETLEKSVKMIVLSGKKDNLISFVNYFRGKSTYSHALDSICNSAAIMQVDVTLSEIIDRLNNNRISVLQGLNETYRLYQNNKDHRRLCDNLVISCGNAIHMYVIKNTTSSAQICSVLDDISRNRSAIFRSSAAELSNQRQEILNSLPSNLRNLIEGGYSFNGSSLNSDGIALRKGLDYLKRLSA